MNYPGKAIMDAIDEVMAESIARFADAMPGVAREITDSTTEFLATLAKNRNGSIKASVANLKAITRFKNTLIKVMLSGEYGTLAASIKVDLAQISTLTNQYFSTISSGFKVTDLYQEIRNQNIATTLEVLTSTGLESQYIAPIQKVLSQAVTGQSSSKMVLQTLREMLSEEGKPTKWAKTYADDALNVYSRTYTEAISEDLSITDFLYAGTVIESSRPFCKSRVGKIFTRKEIEGWATLEWSGKNPATNAGNIFVLAGGYSCRHAFRPLSAAIADELRKG